jgi:hypothetical protein
MPKRPRRRKKSAQEEQALTGYENYLLLLLD